jgi:tRNA (guanine-N7-)-methyltransferase
MRPRKKRHLTERLERAFAILYTEAETFRAELAARTPEAVHLEIGCGKGGFTVQTAAANPEIIFAALERENNALVTDLECAMAEGLSNLMFISADAKRLPEFFEPHSIQRIYINFCDPWLSNKHADRRLTAPGFLDMYKDLLTDDGSVFFKTDNEELFNYSRKTLSATGFRLTEDFAEWLTDYEKKWIEAGRTIYRVGAYLD